MIKHLLLCGMLMAPALGYCQAATNKWWLGFWHLTYDEDHGGVADTIEFRADGTWVDYAPNCGVSKQKYFAHQGDLIAVIEVPNKGPIALIFRPSADHTKLTFTAPRTRNNATYERAALPGACQIAP